MPRHDSVDVKIAKLLKEADEQDKLAAQLAAEVQVARDAARGSQDEAIQAKSDMAVSDSTQRRI